MRSIFEFNDYKSFLKDALPTDGASRGSRNRLAESLGCQKGFVSQVLNGASHFSLEHGIRISHFLKLAPQEEEYFLLILHKDRAGSKGLEKFYESRLSEILERRRQITERISANTTKLSDTDRMTYYSSWHFAAVHMCLLVPELRSRGAITAYLGISAKVAAEVLRFLVDVGLAKQEGESYVAGPSRIHLSNRSPIIGKHHSNWRMKAIDSLDDPKEIDVHYSMIMSISNEAAEKIRELLLSSIQKVEPVMKAARDQEIYALNIDLFGLKDE